MSAVSILFPGQGAQSVGMGRWLCDQYPVAREHFDRASAVLGYDLGELCFDGPSEKLSETEFCQPALFVVGIAAAETMRVVDPDRVAAIQAAAGLSLGEYTAVCFAGGLAFEDGVRLVQRRGEAMQASANAVKSGMASVIGLDLETIQSVCEATRESHEVLQPANLLCPGNIAVSGHLSALERMIPAAESAGAMKVVPLSVAGAFHTSLMEPAVEKLVDALEEMPIKDTRIPVYSNVDAAPHQSAQEIKQLLSRQVIGSVLWEDSIRRMIADGIEKFEEVGTGRILRGTLKRINRKLTTDGFGDES